jgi:hypothetical protein
VIEHEAWFIELLAHKRDGKSIPSGPAVASRDMPPQQECGLLRSVAIPFQWSCLG